MLTTLAFQKATDSLPLDDVVPFAAPLIREAGNPYYDMLFGSSETTATTLNAWMRRASSEVSIRRVQFLLCDSEIAGGFIALSGIELREARRADAMALLQSVRATDRPGLITRLANLSSLFSPVNDDDYYLSKVAVAPPFRGRRLGRVLVERYIAEGSSHGYSRYRLDVHTDNQAAVQCYRAAGFEISSRTESKDGSLKYYSMTYTRVPA
jgi:ribosomal protein S18 acetylase RimI-like enzyme